MGHVLIDELNLHLAGFHEPGVSYFFYSRLVLLFWEAVESSLFALKSKCAILLWEHTTMPALVVWEPLIAAGDDLYLLSTFRICLYLAEMGLGEWSVVNNENNLNIRFFYFCRLILLHLLIDIDVQ